MTLIIAGYDKGFKIKGKLYFFADSAITSIQYNKDTLEKIGHTTYLTGYKKVHAFDIRLSYPKFSPEGRFEKYKPSEFKSRCVVAFAGSAITAHHVLHTISEDLASLKVYVGDKGPCISGYDEDDFIKINREPLVNKELNGDEYYIDIEFLSFDNVDNCLTKEYISSIVGKSIVRALKSARDYKLDAMGIQELACEFLLGLHCNKDDDNYIYKFNVSLDKANFYTPVVKCEAIDKNSIGYIGIKEDGIILNEKINDFLSSSESKGVYSLSLKDCFLDDCIDEFKEEEYVKSPLKIMENNFIDVMDSHRSNSAPLIDYPVYKVTMDRHLVFFKEIIDPAKL